MQRQSMCAVLKRKNENKDISFFLPIRALKYRLKQLYAGVAEQVDATDLKQKLSAPARETRDAELLKFGETFNMAIPSQALTGRRLGKV